MDELAYVAEGTQTDDMQDFRPGRQAALELGVRAPLAEAGLNKQDIRALSRYLGLSTADLPSQACLASRIPYGSPLTEEKAAPNCRGRAFFARAGIFVHPCAASRRDCPDRGACRRAFVARSAAFAKANRGSIESAGLYLCDN